MAEIDAEKYQGFRDLLCIKNSALAFFYTDREPANGTCPPEDSKMAELVAEYQARGEIIPFEELHKRNKCMLSYLIGVLNKGGTAYFDKDHYGCPGGARYMGYAAGEPEVVAQVISTGIPNLTEGEHIFRSPESALRYFEQTDIPPAPASYLVVKRLEDLEDGEEADVVAFLEQADVISGMFGLLAYSLETPDGVISPFGSGCSSLITNPMKEIESENPRAVLGMFDVAARPYVKPEIISLAMPAKVLPHLMEDAKGSFLSGHSWKTIRERISKRRGTA